MNDTGRRKQIRVIARTRTLLFASDFISYEPTLISADRGEIVVEAI